MPSSKWWVYTAAGQIWGRDEEKRNCSGENNGGRKLGFTWRTETLGKARSPHSSHSEREFTHLPSTGVILSVLHWGKLLMLPSCFGRNFLPKFSGFCLLGKQLRACACLVDAASLSFTDVLHATPFFFSPFALTLSVSAVHHPELKIQGLVWLSYYHGDRDDFSAHVRMARCYKPLLQCKPGELLSAFFSS